MGKRILIADDHSAIRLGVKQICAGEFAAVEFGEATNYADVLRLMQDARWDILILDVDLPGRSGLDVLRDLKAEKNPTPVLMFSFHSEEQIALRALRLGAAGYLSKDAADQELVQAIERVSMGRRYVTPALSEALLDLLNEGKPQEPHESLSEREYQTLLLIASGKTVTDIAALLCLSKPTISTYRARILEKMQLKNNAELTTYVISRKLV